MNHVRIRPPGNMGFITYKGLGVNPFGASGSVLTFFANTNPKKAQN